MKKRQTTLEDALVEFCEHVGGTVSITARVLPNLSGDAHVRTRHQHGLLVLMDVSVDGQSVWSSSGRTYPVEILGDLRGRIDQAARRAVLREAW